MKVFFFYFLLLIPLGNVVFAQDAVSGTITDSSGTPLPSVSVVVQGTTVGTSTDFDGKYKIKASQGDVLTVSYLGFKTQTVTIGTSAVYNLSLEEDAAELDEIVVVGYGSQKKADLTGSVGVVKAEALVEAPVGSASQLLAGRVSGLVTTQESGVPGNDATSINIRGFGTPLVLVDGVITGFNRIDPNDIESISVLKDASAAIYGVLSGNGVVLVTTKRGKSGAPKISFSTNTTFQTPTVLPNKVDSWDYVSLIREGAANIGANVDADYPEEDIAKYRNAVDPSYANTDWYDVIFNDMTPMVQHNVSVRGGSEDVKYFTSLGMQDQKSAFNSGDLNFKRYNARVNLDAKISESIGFTVDLSYKREDRDSPGVSISDMYNQLETSKPMYPGILPDPDLAAWGGFNSRAPYAATQKRFGGYDDDVRELLIGRIELNYKFQSIEGLSAKARLNYQSLNRSKKTYSKPYEVFSYSYENDEYTSMGIRNGISSVREDYRKRRELYPSFQLNYKQKFGGHSLDALALVETRDVKDESFWARRINLLSPNIPYLNVGSEEEQTTGASASEQGYMSYAGRLNYNFKNKYFLSATMRADAVGHLFPENSRWGYFPSVSSAWKISSEPFMENFTALNLLKMRASYSKTGLDSNVGAFNYLTGFNINSGTYIIDQSSGASISTNGIPNADITWQELNNFNVGLDGRFWNGKLGFEIDAFYRKRTNIFTPDLSGVPFTFGLQPSLLPQLNYNEDSNRGIDVLLTHENRINNDFSYSIGVNFGFNRQKRDKWLEDLVDVDALDPADFADDAAYQLAVSNGNDFNRINKREGNWTNRAFGYVSDGMFASQAEIDNHPVDQDQVGNSTLLPGDIKYKDINGDGVITNLDQDVIGYGATPNINFGLNLGATYKDFSFSALFQGATNVNMNFAGAARGPYQNNNSVPYDYQLKHRFVYDAVTDSNTNPDALFPMVSSDGVNTNNLLTSDFWFKDASYVRLKSLNVNYSLPKDVISKIGVSKLDIYVSGTNLFTWSKLGVFKDTFDPEGPLTQNGRSYPIMKTYSLGLNISL
jgi:TonB-linked SusC/RagA family outer membrane protein